MSTRLEITDRRVALAYAHPLRARILGLLDKRIASPKELADELGTPLTNTSYHVRQLASLGFLELVHRVPRRGAIEHYYTRKDRAVIPDEIWRQLPHALRRATTAGWLEGVVDEAAAAAEEGGFDRADVHMSRTAGPLDDEGWTAIKAEVERALGRIEAEVEASRERLAADPRRAAVRGTVVLMQFVAPELKRIGAGARAVGPGRPGLALDEPAS